MTTKSATTLALRAPRPLRLLPVLLLLAALLATLQFFVRDPDGGSGIGGTGRFGGESGLGGTGGPLKLGLDEREEERRKSTSPDAQALIALASASIDVANLRTTPEAAVPAPAPASTAPVRVAAPMAVASASPAEPEASAPVSPAALRAEAIVTVRATALPPALPLDVPPVLPTPQLEQGFQQAALADIDASFDASRQVLLAQASSELTLPQSVHAQQPVAIDVHADASSERLRLTLPARPERPDRPTLSLQPPRITPPRGVPAPPVRPMRL